AKPIVTICAKKRFPRDLTGGCVAGPLSGGAKRWQESAEGDSLRVPAFPLGTRKTDDEWQPSRRLRSHLINQRPCARDKKTYERGNDKSRVCGAGRLAKSSAISWFILLVIGYINMLRAHPAAKIPGIRVRVSKIPSLLESDCATLAW